MCQVRMPERNRYESIEEKHTVINISKKADSIQIVNLYIDIWCLEEYKNSYYSCCLGKNDMWPDV